MKYHRLEALKFIPQAHYDKAGRPRQAEEPTRITYQIQATLIANLEVLNVEMTRAGRFILATNVLDGVKQITNLTPERCNILNFLGTRALRYYQLC